MTDRYGIVAIALGLLVAAPGLLAATVYKCVSANGQVTYQQLECHVADQATAIEMKSTRETEEPEALEEPLSATPAEQHYQRLMQQYEAQQRVFEQGGAGVDEFRGRSEEERAIEHLRNRRASQLGITRQELDRREGWKPRAR